MPLFMKRPQAAQIVEAEQIGAGAQAHVQGQRPARPGQWVVTDHSSGTQWVMDDTQFNTEYVPAPIPQHLLAEAAGGTPSAMTPRPPEYPGAGDQSPTTQPIRDAIPGRPAAGPEVRPRLGEDTTVESPTGLPNQPGDADKAFHQTHEMHDVAPFESAGTPVPPDPPDSPEEEALPEEETLPPA